MEDRHKYLKEEEFQRLLTVINEQGSAFDYVFFYVTGNLGLRVGEAVRLRKEDIEFEDKYIRVPTLKQGRESTIGENGKKEYKIKGTIKRGNLPERFHEIPITDETITILSGHINMMGIESGWLFPHYDLLHIHTYTMQRAFKRYAKLAGLDVRYSIHCLRHYRGMKIYKSTQDIKTVQIFLRHEDIKSSAIYTEPNIDDKRKMLENMERKKVT